ncbi:MAG: TIGR00159 family protein [Acidobacteria bacterium]|nr:TIGR00159 family protein [Acidobacteriota bacterium]NIM60170.1 TIGR00159 family protein [Acidobacteriota bacterium]NIO57839.1 TIGR00159 family protein [Acidobacteriota bacterium]NIQ28848.1 TIGR00159 family protein [Acidobacteriota bacterium]NIQ83306.1 TIGR00159 family protein [Acidobacteriota bacterium]
MFEGLYTALHLQELTLRSVLDIAILAVLIYQLLLLIRGTRSVNILLAMAVLALLWVLTGPGLFELKAVHSVLGNLLFYIPLAVLILFQQQIRQALASLGTNPFSAFLPKSVEHRLIDEVALAAAALSSKRVGALIVIARDMGLRTFCETGIALDALVSYDLMINIFIRRSALHDGAVIIEGGRIKAASCFLPLTTRPSLSRSYGTRHRAAIGISEESDAVAVIVSEETGGISIALGGKIIEGLNAQTLRDHLEEALASQMEEKESTPTLVAREAGDA